MVAVDVAAAWVRSHGAAFADVVDVPLARTVDDASVPFVDVCASL